MSVHTPPNIEHLRLNIRVISTPSAIGKIDEYSRIDEQASEAGKEIASCYAPAGVRNLSSRADRIESMIIRGSRIDEFAQASRQPDTSDSHPTS